jgi:hypothetical protein
MAFTVKPLYRYINVPKVNQNVFLRTYNTGTGYLSKQKEVKNMSVIDIVVPDLETVLCPNTSGF